MNNTPTPRTDEQREIIDSIRPDGCHRVEYLLGFASILETELTAVTEQLKETQKHLKDANRGAEINAHALRINADKLAAVTEKLKETQEALAAEIKHHTDIRTAVGDPTAKLMQDELVERCRRMSAVIDAARCIRHWHDREPDGMVVSKSHVFALWQTLNELDKPNSQADRPNGSV